MGWDLRAVHSTAALGSMCSIAAVGGTNQAPETLLKFDQHYAQVEAARVASLVLAFSLAGVCDGVAR